MGQGTQHMVGWLWGPRLIILTYCTAYLLYRDLPEIGQLPHPVSQAKVMGGRTVGIGVEGRGEGGEWIKEGKTVYF